MNLQETISEMIKLDIKVGDTLMGESLRTKKLLLRQ
jgi:hypothetical protein